ncbi:MAG: hypothetical protein AB7S36_15545 [Planctomycetota bacterium]
MRTSHTPALLVVIAALLASFATLATLAPRVASAQGRLAPFKAAGNAGREEPKSDRGDDDNDDDKPRPSASSSSRNNYWPGDDCHDDSDPANAFGQLLGLVFGSIFKYGLGTIFAGNALYEHEHWEFQRAPFANGCVTSRSAVNGGDSGGKPVAGLIDATFRSQDFDLVGLRIGLDILGNTHVGGALDFQYYSERLPGGGSEDLWLMHATWGWHFHPDDLGWVDLGFSLAIIEATTDTAFGPGFYLRGRYVFPDVINLAAHLHVNFFSGGVVAEAELTLGHFFGPVEVRAGAWVLASTTADAIFGPTVGITFWV